MLRYDVNGKPVEREINYIPVRYIFAILITIFEVAAIIGVVAALCYFVPYFYIAAWLTEIVCVVKIVSSDHNPDYKVPWLLFVLILPIAGFMLYFIFSSRTLKKKYVKRLSDLKKKEYRRDDSLLLDQLKKENITASNQAKMICRIADTHLFSGTATRYYKLGEEMMPDLLADLAKAEKFIYLEFFIIEEGIFWNSILEILKEKAAAGIEVKVVYDDIGCMATLPGNYAKQLKKFGIEATPFSRLRGQADSEFNNRSHRKIAVIDGKVGYTGGINIADEYINVIQKYGHWKDIGIRLEGEGVWELTRLFLVDYGINVKEMPESVHNVYPECRFSEGYGYIIPFGDGPSPLYSHRVGKSVIQSMLAAATRYAWMMTPYLIIDNDLCQSIENAAMRGVDVRIIVPHIPDKKMVFAMTRSFYARLLKAGVKIYEYEPGFVHAKCYLVDGEYAMVGTINLDYRSLVHHFENGVWMYHSPILPDIKADFEDTLQKSIAVDEGTTKINFFQSVFRAIVRIFAPLM